MLSSTTHARLYDIPISRAAAEIEPVSRMLSSSLALPGPIRAPDSKTMLILILAMPPLCDDQGLTAANTPDRLLWGQKTAVRVTRTIRQLWGLDLSRSIV